MVFLWLGARFLVLVRVEARKRRPTAAAFLLGLGPLIRPELGLASVVFVVALLLVVASPGWSGSPGRLRRFGAPVVAACPSGRLPGVPDGLLRVAGAQHRSGQGGGRFMAVAGLHLSRNFVAPYDLWLPLLLAAPLLIQMVSTWRGQATARACCCWRRRWWRDWSTSSMSCMSAETTCTPGCCCRRSSRLYPGLRHLEPDAKPAAVPVVGILAWVVICAGWLRYVPPPGGSLNPQVISISNERNSWITATGTPPGDSQRLPPSSVRSGRGVLRACPASCRAGVRHSWSSPIPTCR